MTIYAENLKQVMLELVRSIQIDYARLTGAARNDRTNDGSILNRLDITRWILFMAAKV